jgi:hypothetical protein
VRAGNLRNKSSNVRQKRQTERMHAQRATNIDQNIIHLRHVVPRTVGPLRTVQSSTVNTDYLL